MSRLRSMVLTLVLAGCTPEQCGRIENGGRSGIHQANLELCIKQAEKDVEAKKPRADVEASFKACADAAGSAAGRK